MSNGELARLGDVVQGLDVSIYLLTSNCDGRGWPLPEDDRKLRIAFALSAHSEGTIPP